MENELYDLTAPQKSIWLTEQYYKNTNINNVCGIFLSSVPLDFSILEKSLKLLVKNNESYRIKLTLVNGEVKQYFDKYTDFNIKTVEVVSDEERIALEKRENAKGFELLDSSLFEFTIFKYPDGHGGFIIKTSHIISDSWTNGITANEVSKIYTLLKENQSFEKDSDLSYSNYIKTEQDYLKSEKFKKDKQYWDWVFETVPEIATIPSINQSNNSNISYSAKRYITNLNSEKLEKLKEFCSKNKISLYNLFMGVFALYLGRVSNLDDFVIGTPILNRTNFKEKQITGMFINVLPLRFNLNHELSFTEFVSKVGTDSMGLLRHQRYSYNYILEDLRKKDSSLPGLYNVLFSYQITKMTENNDLPHSTSWTFNESTANDLDIHVFEWNDLNTLQIAYDYKSDKYSEKEISDTHERILHVLDQIIDNENILLKEIEIVTPEEKNKILYKFNNTKVDYPKDKTIAQLFEEQVEKTPDNIAVVFEDQKLTYKELNERANQLANYLIQKNIKPNQVIGIFLNKSLEMIISILSILKINCTFLPIDINYPDERIKYMINDSNCSTVLTFNNIIPKISFLNNVYDVNLNNPEIYNLSNNYDSISKKDTLAYIMYTSGSTGTPKGVMIKQKNIIRLVKNSNFIKFSNNEKIIQTGSIVFDACTFEIWSALLNGYELYIIKKEDLLNPISLENYLTINKITIMWLTAPLLNQLTEYKPQIFNSIKYLLTGGDVLSPKHINMIRNACPNLTIINGYGPTENTTFSTCFTIEKEYSKSIPIGFPISNSTCFVVSKDLNLLPIGIPGELVVGGDGVGKGYLNKPEFTAERFINNPFSNDTDKLYKTGDLVSWNIDGSINFIGRIDNQVKIRGFRIELNEISLKIHDFPNIKEVISIIKNINGEKSICSYFSASTKIDISLLKKHLSKSLPSYSIPTYIIQLDKLPLNANGKVDIKMLPETSISNFEKKIINPRNSIDYSLIELLKGILHIDVVSIDDSFFDLGGDSLNAINLCMKIEDKFNIQISVKDIFDAPIISSLSDLISSRFENNIKLLSHINSENSYCCGSSQKNIYLATKIAGENSLIYNIPGGVIFDKKVNIKKLEKCFNELIKRHESFRTYFELENDNIVQKIIDKIDFKIEILESIISENVLDNEFKNFVKPFDLSTAPLLRAKLINLENDKNALFVDMHHIISDGTSLSIFINELCKLYNGEKLENIEFTYKDFASWENNALSSDYFKEAENYWMNQFKDEIPVLNMPKTYRRPAVKSYEGSKIYSTIDNKTVEKINNICKEYSITPYMLLLSIYYILLSKYTSQDDIIVGSPIVGRNFSEIYNIIGMFVNTLPIRTKIDSSLSFKEFLSHIKNICLENYKYQDYPLNELISKLNIKRDTSRNPLFDTLFIYQNNGLANIDFDGINSKLYIPDSKISKFDFSLEIVPENNILNLNFEYCTKLFNKQFIENFAKHYKNILETVLNNLDIKINSICMLSEKEKNKILYEFNNTKMDYPKDKTISELFEEQVEKTPDNIAVVFEDKKLTYSQLNKKANNLANYLRNNNVGRNDIVGIMVNRSLEMIVGILAVLKAGGTYIPIDPEYPQDRIEYMLQNSNAKLLLTFKNLENKVEFKNKIFIELENKEIYSLNKNNLKNINEPEDSCYIIYTSGSTGLPKGVVLKHKNIINFIFGVMDKIPFSKKDIIVSVTTISFDIFVLESLLPLLNGIKIIIASEKAQTDISLLNELCIANKVTAIQTTPSRMLAYTLDANLGKFIKKMKYFLIGGEPFNKHLLEFLQTNTKAKIFNMYGPTETAVWSSIKDLSDTDKITIGTPISNTQMYILDNNLLPLPIGVPGELYISGDGVCKGYFKDLIKTEKAFIKNPFEENSIIYKTGDYCKYLPTGEIEYIERIDNQVKIRGLRIELGEIENKILEFPNIKKACVIKQTINNRDFISAYFTIKKRINISELRKYLSDHLPRYMVPSYFTILEDFPYTPNGKINKKVLPLPKEILSNSEEKYISPKTNLQIKLVNIFEQILNINPIGINDNFFDLGGDSILAMNLNIELKKITDKISYADIFKFPTVSKLENKINSLDEDYDLSYMGKNYDKYNTLLDKHLKVPSLYDLKYKETGNVLLTGSTGFLGIHILEEFIKNENGKIYCIVRDDVGLSAKLKLQQKLHYYFDTKYDNLIGKRIFAITGDITKPGFGLNQEELLDLSNNIDIVINSAAKVSHFGNYSDFYNINVRSVKYMLEFCKSFNKKFYQISTLSVSGNALEVSTIKQNINQETLFKENNLYIGQSLENVYIRSKFEAECLVLDSILDGLDAYIFRVGNLMPRYKDGLFQENISENAYINRLLGFIKIGAIPEYLKDIYLEFTPIDITANSIIKIISHPNMDFRIFHLFNNNHVYLNKISKYLKQLNENFEIIDEENFKKQIRKILNNSKEKENLNSLLNDFDKDLHLNYFTDIIIKSENTIKYLEKIGFKWPNISDRYLNNFINLLRMVL